MFLRSLARGIALLAVCVGSGCGDSENTRARWIFLAEGYRPTPGLPSEAVGAWSLAERTARLRPAPELGGVWLDIDLPIQLWERDPSGTWSTERPQTFSIPHANGQTLELSVGGEQVPSWSPWKLDEAPSDSTLSYVVDGRVHLRLSHGQAPRDVVWSELLERGHEAQGRRRVVVGNLTGDGLDVWPGERASLWTPLPEQSALRCSTAARLAVPTAGPIRFRIFLNDVPLLDHSQESGGETDYVEHVLPLPPDAVELAEWRFEVDGPPGVSAFLGPVVGPLESGDAAAPESVRPDLVLFVADTLRADALGATTRDDDPKRVSATPELDRFVSRSLSFTQARSVASWTLPAHVSMFTGLFPLQHGAFRSGGVLPDELVTVAEALRAQGYRTGAITDAAWVSRYFGFAQGFEWFAERSISEWDLRATLSDATAFLERADGRPTFLFVHTYRVHEPYRVGEDESRRELAQFKKRIPAQLRRSGWKRGDDVDAHLGPLIGEFRTLYEEGVRGLDSTWGKWARELERDGFFERNFLVFTSDHGEAFYEHGKRFHGGKPYDEEIRIPLFLRGPGIDPREEPQPVSLLDLPRTLAALAGVEAERSWGGQSLLEKGERGPVMAHSKGRHGECVALIADGRKLLTPGPEGVFELELVSELYDLGSDPGERENLAWGRTDGSDLLGRYATALRAWLEPVVEAGEVELSGEFQERMDAIGYTGE